MAEFVAIQTSHMTHAEALDGLLAEADLNEPSMGEKLPSLNLDADKPEVPELEMSAPSTKPPSADSVHVLLRQALNADDRVLLMNCLHTQDDKLIANTVSRLNPSDVLKLLDSLISLIHSRWRTTGPLPDPPGVKFEKEGHLRNIPLYLFLGLLQVD